MEYYRLSCSTFYLKELEFRYNNKEKDLFEKLLEILSKVEYIEESPK